MASGPTRTVRVTEVPPVPGRRVQELLAKRASVAAENVDDDETTGTRAPFDGDPLAEVRC